MRYERAVVGRQRGALGGVLDRRDALDLMHGRSRMTIDTRVGKRGKGALVVRHACRRMIIDPRIPSSPRSAYVRFPPTRQAFACLHPVREAKREVFGESH